MLKKMLTTEDVKIITKTIIIIHLSTKHCDKYFKPDNTFYIYFFIIESGDINILSLVSAIGEVPSIFKKNLLTMTL